MTEPGYVVTLRDVAAKVDTLTTEVHRFGGQLTSIEAGLTVGSAQRADHETRLRSLETAQLSVDMLERYRRQARSAFWVALAALTGAVAVAGGLLSHVRLH